MQGWSERFSRQWRWIIGVVLAVSLAGCSMLRMGYSQAPHLVFWWIDGRLDLDDAQTVQVREAIDRWFEWHRQAEMPRYASLLARAQREVMEPSLTPEQLCSWRDEAQRRSEAAIEQAAPALAALMLSLTPAQIRHFEQKLAKDNDELRKDAAQPDREERARALLKRTVERYENLYGRLDDSQRAKLEQGLAAVPLDAERWLAERARRNQEMVQTIAGVAAAGRNGDAAAQAQARAAVRAIAERQWRSPRPDYRAFQERVIRAQCVLASQVHASTTLAQRQHARDKLKGWEDDVRLIAGSNGNSDGSASR